MEWTEENDAHSVESIPLSALVTCQVDPRGKNDRETRGQWSSQIQYLLSVIGYSVGLGNFWRFPYICNRNGGGAFLIPFLACLVLCGLPVFFLEVALGQFSGKSPVHVWSMAPLMKGLGIGTVILTGGAVTYYTVICSWSLYYAVFSCRAVLPWTSCDNTWNTDNCVTSFRLLKMEDSIGKNFNTSTNYTMYQPVSSDQTNTSYVHSGWGNQTLAHTAAEEFWQYHALRITNGLGEVGSIRWELALCLLGSWTIIFLCVVKGVKSLGKAVYITATLPYVFLAVLLVRGLLLPGGSSGALYYITPDFRKLLNIQVWLEACLQVFYSLGTAGGGLITISSYNKFHENCLRTSLICTFVSEATSLFAGLVVFSILGFLAHEADVPISDVVSSGPGLGFVTYPEVLAQLPLPQLWSVLFFLMLILLAIDYLFGAVETVLSAIFDEFSFLLRWRVPVVIVYCLTSFSLGLVLTTEGGMYIFQLLDWYYVVLFPITAGILECIVVGWIYGVNRFSADIEMMIGRQAPVFFKVTWCFVSPLILLIAFVLAMAQYKPPTYGKYVYPGFASTVGWCLAFVPVLPIFIMATVKISTQQGSLIQRMRRAVIPDGSWRPSNPSYHQMYQEKYRDIV